ncbi:hypothetical protein [Kitasatospora sp. NPDC088351]|uniref:hypothetical protein n=1 Tax=Kitasatospora sp. NPDC088351 TaxID=3155180 RepID=UPI003415521A
MMGTTRQVELLRTEVGQILQNGLQELRADNAALRGDNAALRSELAAAVAEGLRENREELRRTLGREQKELIEARKEIRDLRRQLDEARAGRTDPSAEAAFDGDPDRDPLSADREGSTVWEPTAAAAPDPLPQDDNAPISQEPAAPTAGAPDIAPAGQTASTDRTAQPATLVKETTVTEPTNEPTDTAAEADMVAELAAAVSHLLPAAEASPVQLAPAETPAPRTATGKSQLEAGLFRTLASAACVSAAELVCHPNAWQFIGSRTAAASPHFQFPAAVAQDKTDMVTVLLPGPSLMAVIKALYSAYWAAGSDLAHIEDRALALAYYTAIAHEVRKTQPVTATTETTDADRPRTRIIIDQRPHRSA